MSKVIINAKASVALKKALEDVAHDERNNLPRRGISALIISILTSDERVKKAMVKYEKKKD